MKARWVIWLEQYGKRIIGQGADTEAQARTLAIELAGKTRRLVWGGYDCFLFRNGRLFDHWIEWKTEPQEKVESHE